MVHIASVLQFILHKLRITRIVLFNVPAAFQTPPSVPHRALRFPIVMTSIAFINWVQTEFMNHSPMPWMREWLHQNRSCSSPMEQSRDGLPCTFFLVHASITWTYSIVIYTVITFNGPLTFIIYHFPRLFQFSRGCIDGHNLVLWAMQWLKIV